MTVDFDISKFEGFERFEIVKLRNVKNRKYATDDAIDLLEKIFVYDFVIILLILLGVTYYICRSSKAPLF